VIFLALLARLAALGAFAGMGAPDVAVLGAVDAVMDFSLI